LYELCKNSHSWLYVRPTEAELGWWREAVVKHPLIRAEVVFVPCHILPSFSSLVPCSFMHSMALPPPSTLRVWWGGGDREACLLEKGGTRRCFSLLPPLLLPPLAPSLVPACWWWGGVDPKTPLGAIVILMTSPTEMGLSLTPGALWRLITQTCWPVPQHALSGV